MAKHGATFRHQPAWIGLCLAVAISQGCARPDALRPTSSSTSGEQKLPFHQNSDHASDEAARPALPSNQKSGAEPFHAGAHSRILPAGTLITVRLENSLSISRVRPGDAFTASVAGPVIVEGETLIDRGAPATGRAESSQSAGDPLAKGPTPGPAPTLVRLTLDTVAVGGRSLQLQTSSLYAKGTAAKPPLQNSLAGTGPNQRSVDFRLIKGRRLTFRLTAPVTLSDSNSIAER